MFSLASWANRPLLLQYPAMTGGNKVLRVEFRGILLSRRVQAQQPAWGRLYFLKGGMVAACGTIRPMFVCMVL